MPGCWSGEWTGFYYQPLPEASDPRLQLSYRLAKFLDREMKPAERALILSPPWDPAVFDFYLQRARETRDRPDVLEGILAPPLAPEHSF